VIFQIGSSNPELALQAARFRTVTVDLFRNEGVSAFYKGITPRVLRVAPGQAIVFTVYERVKRLIDLAKSSSLGAEYDE